MDSLQTISNDLVQSITEKEKKKSIPYDTYAKVIRIDGGTAWVHIPGGVDETPVALTVNAKVGDSVLVRVSGGNAWIVGNSSAPPTDDTKAVEAKGVADVAQVKAASAQETAINAATAAANAQSSANAAAQAASSAQSSAQTALTNAGLAQTAAGNAQSSANNAQASADNASEYASRALGNLSTVQSVTETLNWITQHGTMTLTTDTALDPTHVYFVQDNNGDYVVGGVHYAVVPEPSVDDLSTYYELSINESLNNYVATHLSVTAEGLWIIPDAGGNKVLIATGQGSTYTSAGTYIIGANGIVLAKFLASGTTIGAENGAHTTVGADGQTVYKDSTNAIAHIGIGSFPDPDDPDAYIRGAYYTFGRRTGQIGIGSLAHGDGTEASGDYSVSMGVGCIASGEGAVAIGESSEATGNFSFAQGIDDDGYAVASGHGSHAEGTSIASGNVAHGEGWGARAIGNNSHAEGVSTVARGAGSHAGGFETEAQGAYQTAIGKLNVTDATSAFIIGCGKYEDDNPIRKNALTVDWSGNVEAAGDITDGSGNVLADKLDVSGVLNIFYPVGSYYETSDTTFNPNTAWGGTWALETAGKFHVSAGTGYTAGSTGGSADAIVPYHRHSVAKVTAGITGGAHTHDIANRSVYGGSSNYMALYKGGTGTSTNAALSETHTHDLPAHNTDYAGTSGNTTGANMPPYIAVNRWHRTA